ncbi:MAG: DUF945 family protein [Pseudomonadota bacterium]|nr:DUF945 family protein [Pseudomonadota bacterium]
MIKRRTAIALFISCLIFSAHLTATPQDTDDASPTENILGFVLHDRVNGGQPQKKVHVKPEPLILLQQFKANLLSYLKEYEKPIQVETRVEILTSETWKQTLGELPPLMAKTQINAQGEGETELLMSAVEIQDQAVLLNWQGLSGQLNFSESLAQIKAQIQFKDLLFKDNTHQLSLTGAQSESQFDADLIPVNIIFKIPKLTLEDKDKTLNIQKVDLNFAVEKTATGVELNEGFLTLGQLEFQQADRTEISLNHFKITSDGTVKDDQVHYALHTEIGQLSLPGFEPQAAITYVSDLDLRHIDAEALKALQHTARKLQKQHQQGMISKEMLNFAMLGKLMEVMPQLLARSPQLALSRVHLKTPQGSLQGKATLRMNGQKATSFEAFTGLLNALEGQANFSIDKTLLTIMISSQIQQRLKTEQPELSAAERQAQAEQLTEERIQSYLQKKWLVTGPEDRYKIVAQLSEGQLSVNGVKVPLPFLEPPQAAVTTHQDSAEPHTQETPPQPAQEN